MTAKKSKADEPEMEAEEEEVSEQNAEGAVATPVVEPEAVSPQRLGAVGNEPAGNPADIDDGVTDSELGPPILGQFVQILSGDYQGHFAAYLGNVALDDDGNPTVIQVRTRDADNVILDVPYGEVSSTTYSGGR